GLGHVHQAEVIERGALLFIAFGEIDGESRRGRETNPRFLRIAFGEILELSGIAVQGESDLPFSAGGLRVVVELPGVARAIVADRRGAKLPGDERRHESAAALVLSGDKTNRQAGTGAFAVEIHSE